MTCPAISLYTKTASTRSSTKATQIGSQGGRRSHLTRQTSTMMKPPTYHSEAGIYIELDLISHVLISSVFRHGPHHVATHRTVFHYHLRPNIATATVTCTAITKPSSRVKSRAILSKRHHPRSAQVEKFKLRFRPR